MANPSDHTDDDTVDSIASMGTGTMGTVSSRGTHKARYKLDEVLDHAVVHAPLMRTLIGPALESLDPNDDPNAQAAVDDAIEAAGGAENVTEEPPTEKEKALLAPADASWEALAKKLRPQEMGPSPYAMQLEPSLKALRELEQRAFPRNERR